MVGLENNFLFCRTPLKGETVLEGYNTQQSDSFPDRILENEKLAAVVD